MIFAPISKSGCGRSASLLLIGTVLLIFPPKLSQPIQKITPPGQLKLLSISQAHQDIVQGVEWSPDGKYIATASYDGTVHILDAGNGQLLASYSDHMGHIWRVAWSPDSKYVASGGDDAMLRVWNVANGQLAFKGAQGSPIRGIAWSQNNSYLASSDRAGQIKIWDTTHIERIAETMKIDTHHPEGLYELAWSHNSSYLTVGNDTGSVE